MIAVKLTDERDRTRPGCGNETQWGPNGIHTAPGGKGKLCTDAYIHYYSGETVEDAALVAVFMNPVHGDYDLSTAHLWRVEVGGEIVSDGLKSGATSVATVERIELPTLTLDQRVATGILCALEGQPSADFRAWADRWLDGIDRSQDATTA